MKVHQGSKGQGLPFIMLILGYIVPELSAIYLVEMTKNLVGIFGKGLPWDIKNGYL